MLRRRTALPLALAALALPGCSGSKDKGVQTPKLDVGTTTATATTGPGAPNPTTPTTATTPLPAALKKKPAAPKVSAHVKRLVKKDLIVGTGAVAKAGDNITVQYVGVLAKNRKQFDASWDHGQPFQLQLGAGQVIPGWDQGIPGMKVGGRRVLVIPPALGYGAQAQNGIPANSTLEFVVDLDAIG
jgi:peptidylprolyl isomerase